jgi:hypothetical protein
VGSNEAQCNSGYYDGEADQESKQERELLEVQHEFHVGRLHKDLSSRVRRDAGNRIWPRGRIFERQQTVADWKGRGLSVRGPLWHFAFANEQGRSVLPSELVAPALRLTLTPKSSLRRSAPVDQKLSLTSVQFNFNRSYRVAAATYDRTPAVIGNLENFVSHRIVAGRAEINQHGEAAGVNDDFAVAHTHEQLTRFPRRARISLVNRREVPREFIFVGGAGYWVVAPQVRIAARSKRSSSPCGVT